MAGFFGPSQIGRPSLASTQSQDFVDQIAKAISQRYGQGLPGLGGEGRAQPQTLANLGYLGTGPILYSGQQFGSAQPSLSIFEGVSGGSPESITQAIAQGNLGRSASIQPLGTPQTQSFGASLPSVPIAPQISMTDLGTSLSDPIVTTSGGNGPGIAELIGPATDVAGSALSLALGDQRPSMPVETRGRDFSWATGSPSGISQQPTQFDFPVNQTVTPDLARGQQMSVEDILRENVGPEGAFTPGGAGADMGGLISLDFSNPSTFAGGNGFALPQMDFGTFINALGLTAGGANLVGGIQAGDPLQAVGGLGQTLQGAVGVVGPQNMQALAGIINQALPTELALSGTHLANIASVPGGLLSLYGLYQGIQTGDPTQIASSLYGVYQGASSVSQLAGGQAFPAISDLIGQIPGVSQGANTLSSALGFGGPAASIAASNLAALAQPAVAAALGIVPGAAGTAGSAGAATLAPTLGAAAGTLGAAAPFIAALVSYFGAQEESAARRSGWWNNPIRGALYSGATEGVLNANQILDQIAQGGDLSTIPTFTLTDALSSSINNLLPYYATAQGGAGAIRASESAGSPGLQSRDEYTANFTQARTGVENLVNELLSRGVTYEQLGGLPGVSGDWAQQTLDAGNTPQEMLARSPRYGEFAREAQGLYSASGLGPYGERFSTGGEAGDWMSGGEVLNPEQQIDRLLSAVLGSSMLAPADVTKASGLYTSMYGGPLWAALARMGVADPGLQSQIQQNFDPWTLARTWTEARPGTRQIPGDLTYINDVYMSPSTGETFTPAEWQGIRASNAAIEAENARRAYDPTAAGRAYWDNILQQQVQAAQQQTAAQFADFQRQLQDFLAQQAAGSVSGIPGLTDGTPAAPLALGSDFGATFAAATPAQQTMLRNVGLDPELLKQLAWFAPPQPTTT